LRPYTCVEALKFENDCVYEVEQENNERFNISSNGVTGQDPSERLLGMRNVLVLVCYGILVG
jgi:hypothetical protein